MVSPGNYTTPLIGGGDTMKPSSAQIHITQVLGKQENQPLWTPKTTPPPWGYASSVRAHATSPIMKKVGGAEGILMVLGGPEPF
jgi:hypothetical protein